MPAASPLSRDGSGGARVLARARPRDAQGSQAAADGAAPSQAPVPLWERAFLVVALLAQQDAFLNLLRIARGADSADPNGEVGASDPISSLLVLVSFGTLAALSVMHGKAVTKAARANGLALALAGLAFLSASWSVDAGLTVKRGLVYLVTLGLPLYIAARLGLDAGLRVVATAFGIAAFGSLLVGAAVPSIGVMHTAGLAGDWRGVFSHKNPLAQSMLLGVLIEAYLFAKGPRRLWHGGVMGVEILLILLSRSFTALVVVVSALGVFGAILAFRREGPLRRLLTFGAPAAFAVLAAAVIYFPQALQQASGKDATLTGRTELWAAVGDAIGERPFTGWGFQAFWQPGNRRAQELWAQIGWTAPNSHNGFLDIALGLGPLGLLLAAAVVVQALVRGGRLMRERDAAVAGAAVLVTLGAILVHSLTEATLVRQGDVDWVVFNLMSFMAAGLLGSRALRERQGDAEPPIALRRARPR